MGEVVVEVGVVAADTAVEAGQAAPVAGSTVADMFEVGAELGTGSVGVLAGIVLGCVPYMLDLRMDLQFAQGPVDLEGMQMQVQKKAPSSSGTSS